MGQSGKQESPTEAVFRLRALVNGCGGKRKGSMWPMWWCSGGVAITLCGHVVQPWEEWQTEASFSGTTKRLSCGFVVLNYQKERGSGGKRLSMHGTTRGFQFHSRITLFTFHQLQHSRPDHVIRRVPRWMSFCRAIGYGNLFDATGTRVPYCQFDSLKKLTSQNQLRCGNVGRVVNSPGDVR